MLNLTNVFIYHYILLLFLVLSFGYLTRRKWLYNVKKDKLTKQLTINYLKEFFSFCHPLISFSFLAFLAAIFDRWLLQKFAGSVEQGFYGLSFRIAAICILFTSAMVPLITRELSIAYSNLDYKKMAHIFRRYVPLLYSIAAFFACFVVVQAEDVSVLIGGSEFKKASLALSIMAFYPIHQTYGQLGTAVLFAAGRTKLYRNIGIVFQILGLPVLFFLIAPENMFGFNAGATGLAFKMVAIQIIAVNVQLYFNAKFLKLNFYKLLAHQIVVIVLFLLIAFSSEKIVSELFFPADELIYSFIGSGVIYTLIVFMSFLICPIIFGLNYTDVSYIKNKLKSYV